MEIDAHNLQDRSPGNRSAIESEVVKFGYRWWLTQQYGCHCWLAQQCGAGIRGPRLDEPAVAHFINLSFKDQRCVGKMPRTRAAYSYIELTVVLLICSILGAAAIPRYSSALLRLRADAAAKRIAADITYLQRQALYRSASQSIVFTPNGGSGTPNSYSMPTVQYVDFAAAGKVINLAQQPFNATIVSASFSGSNTLSFDRYGMPSAGGTVVIAAGGYQKTVQVDSSTGDVTIP